MKIEIERLGINGEGVGVFSEGKDSGKIIFVKNALPNENVEIDIIKDAKSFCVGKLINIYKQSSKRVTPKCKYYGVCGGCQLQHMSDDLQIEFKKESVKSTIKKISGLDLEINNYIYEKTFNYRNKMVFPIGSKNGKGYIGMFVGESRNVTPVDSCLLASTNINNILSILNNYIEENFKGFSFRENKGDIKYIVIRESSNEMLITFVATKKIKINNLYDILCKYVKNLGISLIISDSDDEILSGKYYHIEGLESLQLNEFGVKYNIDNRGFLQVNDTIKEKLYSKVCSLITKEDIVFDGYSGAGLLTAIISKNCKKVIGVEINHSACESAKKLIKNNNLTNVDYYEGDVKDFLEKIKSVNKVILDPPRSGCDKFILENLLKMDNIKDIIYISCNPSTLARDLGVLKEKYTIVNMELFDMFPNTKHVETLVCLKRNK